jgi:hypothetical protein
VEREAADEREAVAHPHDTSSTAALRGAALRDHRRPPAIARIVAVADIPAGGEIVHPYVGRHGAAAAAAREPGHLRDYGFECACSRCVRR